MAKAKSYVTQTLARDDEELAAIAGLSRGSVRYYCGTRDGGEIFRVLERADRSARLFVELDADGATLHCDCGRSRCSHRGAVLLWIQQRARMAANAAA